MSNGVNVSRVNIIWSTLRCSEVAIPKYLSGNFKKKEWKENTDKNKENKIGRG